MTGIAPRAAAARTARRVAVALGTAALSVHSFAFTVQRVNQSLRDTPTTFVPAANAPQTVFRPAGGAGELRTHTPVSSFDRAEAPPTLFREAEVPPSRLERTRQLLGVLKARQTPQQTIVIDLPADVLFDFDKSDLRPDAEVPLAKAADLLRSYADAPVEIHGHTDSKGSDAYNDALSVRRAETVARRLGELTDGRRFTIRGFGEREPVAPNAHPDGSDDPQGRQRNRRVAILIQPRR